MLHACLMAEIEIEHKCFDERTHQDSHGFPKAIGRVAGE